MKIKQRPDDFVVRELDRYELRDGPFALYRLEKWDIGTIEAVRNVSKAWKIARGRISFGGLKDRHARTEQVISIHGGPERSFEGSTFRLRYLGRSRDPVGRENFDANAFTIVVRDLRTIPDLEPVRRWGVPNYFDDQRFGSLRGTGGEFIGRCLVLGDVERALKLAIASPSREDRGKRRAIKTRIRDLWGEWKALLAEIGGAPERRVLGRLAETGSFARAFESLDPDLRILYVSAYQSHLWNRVLVEHVRRLPETFAVPYAAGTLVFWRSLPDDRLFELEIPLVTPTSPMDEIAAKVLAEEGVEQRQFRLKHLEGTFFGKGTRPAVMRPARLQAETGEDELNRGQKKWTLSFELPKGSYATVLLKALFPGETRHPAVDV